MNESTSRTSRIEPPRESDFPRARPGLVRSSARAGAVAPTMITLALVISVFSDLSAARKTILVLCAVPAAVVANTLRLAVTAIGAYSISAQFAEGTLHEISGLIVFFAGFILLLLVFLVLRWAR